MFVSRMGSTISVWAPAKLNLFLEVRAKRADGFHELETLMCPISLLDRLIFSFDREPRLSLECSDALGAQAAGLPEGTENIVVRALELARRQTGARRGASVRLVKRIPIAAGLAGGSSDAAAALLAANLGWNLRLDGEALARLGAELGSDVPFFFAGGPALCRGRGELVEPLRGLAPLNFVVIHPNEGLSTAAVYGACRPSPEPASAAPLIAAWKEQRMAAIAPALHNQLEPAAAKLSPVVARLRSELARHDVVAHQMSGSGTSFFGICRSARHARHVAGQLRGRRLGQVFAVRSFA